MQLSLSTILNIRETIKCFVHFQEESFSNTDKNMTINPPLTWCTSVMISWAKPPVWGLRSARPEEPVCFNTEWNSEPLLLTATKSWDSCRSVEWRAGLQEEQSMGNQHQQQLFIRRYI